MPRFQSRRNKLRRSIRKEQLDGLLVTNESNVTYLTGFTGDSSFLLVTRDGEVMISDSRYTTQLEEQCPGLKLHIRGPEITTVEAAIRVVKQVKPAALGIEADSMTVAAKENIESEAKRSTLTSTSGLVEVLRQIKDKDETEAIRRAVRQAEKAFAVLRARLRADVTEKHIADDLEREIRLHGAKQTSFSPIVAVGANAALPHYQPGQTAIGAAPLVLVDWGADEGLYKSDLTRVLVTGKIPPKLEAVYTVVLKAQRRAIAAIRPGISCHDVDAAARGVIEKAGYGRYFGHGLGHGVGLDIHEAPRLGPDRQQTLEAGMVVTVEPGIYLPGRLGVRIEDDVLVTKDGCEVLSGVPREFEDAVVS